jgi:hypothetical protein
VQETTLSRRHLLLSVTLFILVFGTASWSLSTRAQIADLGGLLDEWYVLGLNLSIHGTLGAGQAPSLFRAPGYPAVEAVAIRALAGPWPAANAAEYVEAGRRAVYLVQALLLAISSAIAFLWLRGLVRAQVAFVAALLLGLNPYALVFTGALRYDILFLTGVLASCWALEGALKRQPPSAALLLHAGVWCGLTTLVRPLLLAFPAFLLLAIWFRMRTLRPALRATAWVGLGMALTIAPYTARNLLVSGRPVLVSAQTWSAVWGSTVKRLPIRPNSYRWYGLSREVVVLYTRVTGEANYSSATWLRYSLEIEDAFRAEALANLRAQPIVYVANCVGSLYSFAVDSNTSVLTAFQETQHAPVRQFQFSDGRRDALRPSIVSRSYGVLMGCLTLLAAAGVVMGLRLRDGALALPAAFWMCLWLGHGLTYMDMLYYFVKLPFLIVFAALLVDRLQTLAVQSRPRRLAYVACLSAYLTLLLASLLLDAGLFVAPV